MSKKSPHLSGRTRNVGRSRLSMRLETVRYLNEFGDCRPTIPVQAIAEALVKEGYTSLDKQAKALGLHRATAWTIMKKTQTRSFEYQDGATHPGEFTDPAVGSRDNSTSFGPLVFAPNGTGEQIVL